ncbi:MAG: glycosyl hydrolase, partial [Acidimicrobiales bacterium]
GRTLVLSWNTGRTDRTFTKWADITAGLYDAEIDARAEAVKAFGAPLIFVFNHEPNNGNNVTGETAGTSEEFTAAYRYIHDRFIADGVTNVSFGLVLMAWTFRQGLADQWYPGDAYVDILGADGYNWYGCNGFGGSPWARVEEIFTDFREFGLAHNKAMIAAEWASGEDLLDPNRKAQWIRDGAATWKSWPEIKGISWFNTGTNPGCPRYVDTTPESLAAFAEIGADPYFNPTAVVSITDGPPSVTDATTATFSFTSSRADASFACSLDGAPQEPCASPYPLAGIESGPHRLEVRASDAAGVFGNPSAWSWQVTGPVTTILSGPAAMATATSATFSWSSTNAAATYACSLDGAATAPCSSPTTYDGLATGPHTFTVVGADAGVDGPVAAWTWTVVAVGASISVTNNGYSPKTATVPLGTAARWTFTSTSPQSVTDASSMGLWDSGPLSSGAVFDVVFFGAGVYSYKSTTSTRTGTVRVPMSIAPATGTLASPFTVTWASSTAPPGYVYDVQLKRPGRAWVTWQNATTNASTIYVPDGTTGTYSFRARLRNLAAATGSGWSVVSTVSVT